MYVCDISMNTQKTTAHWSETMSHVSQPPFISVTLHHSRSIFRLIALSLSLSKDDGVLEGWEEKSSFSCHILLSSGGCQAQRARRATLTGAGFSTRSVHPLSPPGAHALGGPGEEEASVPWDNRTPGAAPLLCCTFA